MSYHEADLSRLKTVPIAGRANKVEEQFLAKPPGSDRSFHAFLDSLPDILAARDLRTVISHVAEACRALGLPLLPGVATASEVMAAADDGFRFLKFFPASAAGGPATSRADRRPRGRFLP